MIYEKLFDWQKNIVDKFQNQKSLGLFLDMGLGKTPISLAFTEINRCTKILIITINSKALEPKEIKDSWLGWLSQSNIQYNFSIKDNYHVDKSTNDVLIVNYESLFMRHNESKSNSVVLRKNISDFIESCKGHKTAIIIDESHKMKSLQSLQTKAINKIKSLLTIKTPVTYSYLLTGTPFTTGYIDLYSQLKFLGYQETKEQFIAKFCVRGNLPGLLGWQQPIVGYKNKEELFQLIHEFAVTIESSAVINLPEQIFINHKSKMSEDFEMFTQEKLPADKIYNYIIKNNKEVPQDIKNSLLVNKTTKVNNLYYRDILFNGQPSIFFSETVGNFWLRSRQISIGFIGNAENSVWLNHERLNQLKEFLNNNEDNYVLFYNYTPELIELYNICEELNYNIDVYCGEAKSLFFYQQYSSLSEEQKLTNKKNIILANFASGSTGLNWQLYNKCIIFSIPLYKDYAQALKRIHRTGQKKTVFYHTFYQENWLDLSMMKALKEQKQYNEDMFKSEIEKKF